MRIGSALWAWTKGTHPVAAAALAASPVRAVRRVMVIACSLLISGCRHVHAARTGAKAGRKGATSHLLGLICRGPYRNRFAGSTSSVVHAAAHPRASAGTGARRPAPIPDFHLLRSEEHTSELQSRGH